MTLTVLFDADKCQGYANCIIEAPEVWDFDEDNDRAVLRDPHPDEALRAKTEATVRCCPAQAIQLDVDPS
jgi:ferredoxin